MKPIAFLIIMLSLLSCTEQSSFESIPCEDSGQTYMVFKPCRQMIFNAKLWDAEFNLISEDRIWMMATGQPWGYDTVQHEITVQYEFDQEDVDRINQENINKSLDHSWVNKTTTGVWENEKSIGMHSFRQNQYTLTEIAPFPDVRLPLEVGKIWNATFTIYEGWGDWSDSKMKNYYEVVSYETIELSYGKLDAWHINSYTEAPFGNSTHNFWFHPKLGFVKMIIHNYSGQTLEIELIDVIDN